MSIKVAIAGVGNCASSLVQGLEYYRNYDVQGGLINPKIGRWRVGDIQMVAAFDIDLRKVGRKLHEAIYASPNCAAEFVQDIQPCEVTVKMGPVLDGIAEHMNAYPEDRAFRIAEDEPVDVAKVLADAGAEVLVCFLPVGSEKAVKYYAEASISAGVAFVNCVPVFIASNADWAHRFSKAGIPIIGDDIKSQLGATILHRHLAQMFVDRGVSLDRTYQINTGGNTDFLNMLARDRLASKKVSKTDAVQSVLSERLNDGNIHIGPSDYVSWQRDGKVAFVRLEGSGFAGNPVEVELRLSVQDSPNSAGVVVDAIRCAKIGLEEGLGGPMIDPCSVYMKSPPVQFPDAKAHTNLATFLEKHAAE